MRTSSNAMMRARVPTIKKAHAMRTGNEYDNDVRARTSNKKTHITMLTSSKYNDAYVCNSNKENRRHAYQR